MDNIQDIINNKSDLFKKPKAIQPINKTIIRSVWKTMGNSICDPNPFLIDDLVKKMVSYFETETEKGIAVLGGVGVGKSLNFIIYQRIRTSIGEGMNVMCMDVKEIEHNFKLKGQPFIDELITVPELIINDIGTDATVLKNFGSSVEIVDEVLSLRYIKWQKVGGAMKTHISSNLDAGQFKSMYGDRIADRLREMFFIINVPAETKSYRIKKEI